ncbi:MAG: peptidoglycan-binding domain-containing protein [Candidatus Omnitrophota bacterium]|nr:peptidoglycan-binding domain-containing protein [Candidatus Omnitrophota bacterium]
MRKFGFIVLVFALGIYLVGCGNKQQTLEEMQQPMSMETLSTMSTTTPAAPEVKIESSAPEAKVEVAPAVSKAVKLESLPPAGPYKPAATEIQRALKNAGFYTGAIDGKIGAKTKKAIAAFQKANGLTGDGKVGPKTWGALSKYLNPEAAPKAR